MFLSLTLIIAPVILLFLYHVRRKHHFFSDRGIPGPTPWPIVGNIWDNWSRPWMPVFLERERVYGKVYGIFHFLTPTLVVSDVSLLKHILVRDFNHFTDRETDRSHDPVISRSLIGAKGEEWKDWRKAAAPFFSPRNLKAMMPLFEAASDRLVKEMDDMLSRGEDALELRSLMTRFSLDALFSSGLGIEVDVYHSPDPKIVSLTKPNQDNSLSSLLSHLLPEWLKYLLGIHMTSDIETFCEIAKHVLQTRRSKDRRKRDGLVDLVTAFEEAGSLTDDDIISNLVAMFLGSYDAVAILLSCTLFLLAGRPDLQDRLVTQDRDYSSSRSTLMDSLLMEVMRLYPPSCHLRREVTKPFKMNGHVLPIGLRVFVPGFNISRHEDNFPDPLTFDAERFLVDNERAGNRFAVLTFGQGPRNCPAVSYSLVQAKILLSRLLHRFTFTRLVHRTTEASADEQEIDVSGTVDEELMTQPLFVRIQKRKL